MYKLLPVQIVGQADPQISVPSSKWKIKIYMKLTICTCVLRKCQYFMEF
jgi:hypothetical protein